MKTIQLDLTDADENRLARIRKLRYAMPHMQITDEELIKNAIAVYWLQAEKRNDEKNA